MKLCRSPFGFVLGPLVVLGCGSTDGEPSISTDAGLPVDASDLVPDAGVRDGAPRGPCEDVSCAFPPPNVCTSGHSARSYRPVGRCAGGACVYDFEDASCAPASCVAGVGTAASVCEGGRCVVGAAVSCAFGCAGDRCAGDPCAAVVCDTPPASVCVGLAVTRTFDATGSCLAGRCAYESRERECASGMSCVEGACVCTAESDASMCARLGARCGSITNFDTCGTMRTIASCGACGNGMVCSDLGVCVQLGASMPPTSAGYSGQGLSDCGPTAGDSCAASLALPGGTFFRDETMYWQSTVSAFRLDKYEVTVGRFRKFVSAWAAGWRPAAGSGKHTHLAAGAGLTVGSTTAREGGWQSAWAARVGVSVDGNRPDGFSLPAATVSDWNGALASCGGSSTWTAQASTSDRLPMTCLNWYDAYAFCVWDGGYLPSESESRFATFGGGEARPAPWGASPSSADPTRVVIGTLAPEPVGSRPLGAGRWGHLDLFGNAREWLLDGWSPSPATHCIDCVDVEGRPEVDATRVIQGTGYAADAMVFQRGSRDIEVAILREGSTGLRCARAP